jgi:23S rRNA pseudouridine955/2504/2580 synthase
MSLVVETRAVTEDEDGLRLDRWFKRHFATLSHIRLEKLLRTGQVRVEGKRATAATRLQAGQMLRIPPMPDLPKIVKTKGEGKKAAIAMTDRETLDLQKRVLYRDDDVIVIDKPAGLATQGGTGQKTHLDGMLGALRFGFEEDPRLVHRLDKDTSGVLVLGRSAFAAAKLSEAFRSRDSRKYYWALVAGIPEERQGKIATPLKKYGEKQIVASEDDPDGKWAVSFYEVVEQVDGIAAWVALWPHTGRTHQLRVHMQVLGTPIVGDRVYGQNRLPSEELEFGRGLHLHAQRLILPHPRPTPRRRVIDVSAPLPPHMKTSWQSLGFDLRNDGDPFRDMD